MPKTKQTKTDAKHLHEVKTTERQAVKAEEKTIETLPSPPKDEPKPKLEMREKARCDICMRDIFDMQLHLKSTRHKVYENLVKEFGDKFNRQNRTILLPCGKTVSSKYLLTHKKSQKHINNKCLKKKEEKD